ncbi:hypothetical protein [Thalassobacillus sp. C254]|uniref:hypothetical protein n=1 Tax=Thalassobacillus sp. C254 TaxID=1225341 RepID=UPI0006D14859|nr:hypothetical protein [Thalassobacillus sp. C254]
MSENFKNGLISAAMFAGIAILFGYFVYEEIRWGYVIGLSIGGFISWCFIIPWMNKRRVKKEQEADK